MWSVLVNGVACIVGAVIGLLLKKIIKEETSNGMLKAVGLSVLLVGIVGAVTPIMAVDDSTELMLLLVITLVIGTLIGELIRLDDHINNFGDLIEEKVIKSKNPGSFSVGFISSSLFFCAGAMAIVGGIQAALGDHETYLVKSLIDGVTAMALAATLGYGVCFSFIPVMLYQGLIVLFGSWLKTVMPDSFIDGFSVVGFVIVMGIGINFLLPKEYRMKIANMIPSVILVILYYAIFK